MSSFASAPTRVDGPQTRLLTQPRTRKLTTFFSCGGAGGSGGGRSGRGRDGSTATAKGHDITSPSAISAAISAAIAAHKKPKASRQVIKAALGGRVQDINRSLHRAVVAGTIRQDGGSYRLPASMLTPALTPARKRVGTGVQTANRLATKARKKTRAPRVASHTNPQAPAGSAGASAGAGAASTWTPTFTATVDPSAPAGAVFTSPGVGVYDAALRYVDQATNANKFYVLQLVHGTDGNFYVFQKWGRVGCAGQTKLVGPVAQEAAVRTFEKKFKEKTGVAFGSGNAQMRGKYQMNRRLLNAGANTGDVAFSLIWDNNATRRNDLDLHIVPPSGEEISYRHKQSACGGTLDVDRQQGADQPVENVVWKNAPRGNYRVYVNNYSQSSPLPCPCKVGISIRGELEMIDHVAMPLRAGVAPKTLIRSFEY